MISKDKQYRTRDGREVRIYATDGGMKPIHGAIKTIDGEWLQSAWYSDGRDQYGHNQCDLIEVKPRIQRTVWLNVYDNEVIHGGWRTKDEADEMTHRNRIASEAADYIEKLESLFPAILEYLEDQADVVDGDNGIPAPNRAMSLLVWTQHALGIK